MKCTHEEIESYFVAVPDIRELTYIQPIRCKTVTTYGELDRLGDAWLRGDDTDRVIRRCDQIQESRRKATHIPQKWVEKDIIPLRAAGVSVREIERRTGISRYRISNMLKKGTT